MSPNTSWSLQPTVAIGAAIIVWVYVRRWRAVRAQDGARSASGWRLASFVGGNLAVVVALISPLDSLSDEMFFAHMIQHVLLLDAAPILCILGLTKVILRPATKRITRFEDSLGPISHPIFAAAFYVGDVWAWHIPAAYDYAVQHPLVHTTEHITYLIAGSLYWWHLLSPIRSRMRLSGMGPPMYMAGTKLGIGILGIVLAFAPSTLYPYYAHLPSYWGLSPHNDQALGGMVMAIEQSLVMGVALAMVFIRMLSESETDEQRTERYAA